MNKSIVVNAIILSIIGLLYGIVSTWGLIEVYIVSYQFHFDHSIETSTVHTLTIVLTAVAVPASWSFGWTVKNIGYKESIMILLLIGSGGLFICGNVSGYWGMFFGILIIGFTKHLWQQVSNMIMMTMLGKERIGLACGLGVLGGAFGPLYWGFMASFQINPKNDAPDITRDEGQMKMHYFDYKHVAHHFTGFMEINSLVMLGVAQICVPFITNPPNEPDGKLRAWIFNLFRRVSNRNRKPSQVTEEPLIEIKKVETLEVQNLNPNEKLMRLESNYIALTYTKALSIVPNFVNPLLNILSDKSIDGSLGLYGQGQEVQVDFEELKQRYLRGSHIKNKNDPKVQNHAKKDIRMNKILSVNLNNDNLSIYEKASQITAPMNLRMGSNNIKRKESDKMDMNNIEDKYYKKLEDLEYIQKQQVAGDYMKINNDDIKSIKSMQQKVTLDNNLQAFEFSNQKIDNPELVRQGSQLHQNSYINELERDKTCNDLYRRDSYFNDLNRDSCFIPDNLSTTSKRMNINVTVADFVSKILKQRTESDDSAPIQEIKDRKAFLFQDLLEAEIMVSYESSEETPSMQKSNNEDENLAPPDKMHKEISFNLHLKDGSSIMIPVKSVAGDSKLGKRNSRFLNHLKQPEKTDEIVTRDQQNIDNISNKSKATEKKVKILLDVKDFIETLDKQQIQLYYSKFLKTYAFWNTFIILTFSLAVNYLYMINIKAFGLQYFSDDAINCLSFVMVPIAFVGRLGSGMFVDKIGVIISYRIILMISAVSQILFMFFMDNQTMFYIQNGMFLLNYSFVNVMISSIGPLLYGQDLGKKYTPIFYQNWCTSTIMTNLIDTFVLNIFGINACTWQCVGQNVAMFFMIRRPQQIEK